MRSTHTTIALFILILTVAGLWVHAGQLTPPAGPVAPTMKTLDEISAQISAIPGGGGGGASIKRVLRGVVDLAQGVQEANAALSATIDPARSVVVLSDVCMMQAPVSNNAWTARSGACVIDLTATQITVRIDACASSVPTKVNYQIIEYN